MNITKEQLIDNNLPFFEYDEKYEEYSFEELSDLAKNNDANAILQLADMYRTGEVGEDADFVSAFKLYSQLLYFVKSDYVLFWVGRILCSGVLGEERKGDGIVYLESAHALGYEDAAYFLGRTYYEGEYVTGDYDKAISYFTDVTDASELYANALGYIGAIHFEQEDAPAVAFDFLSKAFSLGMDANPFPFVILYNMYLGNIAVSPDFKTEVHTADDVITAAYKLFGDYNDEVAFRYMNSKSMLGYISIMISAYDGDAENNLLCAIAVSNLLLKRNGDVEFRKRVKRIQGATYCHLCALYFYRKNGQDKCLEYLEYVDLNENPSMSIIAAFCHLGDTNKYRLDIKNDVHDIETAIERNEWSYHLDLSSAYMVLSHIYAIGGGAGKCDVNRAYEYAIKAAELDEDARKYLNAHFKKGFLGIKYIP